jgi:hypothetical protein
MPSSSEDPVGTPEVADAEWAAAPARWLLEMGLAGVSLTQTHALARSVVREAVERWPDLGQRTARPAPP